MLKDKIHIIAHQWLEDCLEMAQRLQEDSYNLNPNGKRSIENMYVQIEELEITFRAFHVQKSKKS